MTTITTDSSVPNFTKIKASILAECSKKETRKYSLLDQTSYSYQDGVEKISYLVKVDFPDIIVQMTETDELSGQKDFGATMWESMVKYGVGARWSPPTQSEKWTATSRYPENQSIVTESQFYSKFWFSASETQDQLSPFGRDIYKYNQSTDSFSKATLKEWDESNTTFDVSTLPISGVVLDYSDAINTTKNVILDKNPSTVVGDNEVLVFNSTNNGRFALIGSEIFQKRSTLGKTGYGYRSIFYELSSGDVSSVGAGGVVTSTTDELDQYDSVSTNNSMSQATDLGSIQDNSFFLSPTLTVNATDRDYFKFTLSKASKPQDYIVFMVYDNPSKAVSFGLTERFFGNGVSIQSGSMLGGGEFVFRNLKLSQGKEYLIEVSTLSTSPIRYQFKIQTLA